VGAIQPGSNPPEPSAGSEDAGVDCDAAEADPRSASIDAKNASRAATSTTVFAVSTRALAAAMREPLSVRAGFGALSTPLTDCAPSGVRSAFETPRSGGGPEVLMTTMEANQAESEMKRF
jgi:hypothetical protein